jgi:predicted Kef-type K+ transport protein
LLPFVLQIGGALIGPHALNIISDVHAVQHLAELGVVFLLFNIGLELSLERLQSMAKYVFGMGAAQVSSWCAVRTRQLGRNCYDSDVARFVRLAWSGCRAWPSTYSAWERHR